MLWRRGTTLNLTLVVKASFSLHHDGSAALIEPEPIVTEAVHHQLSPARSIRQPSDLAPYRPHTDVLLVGHAYAPPGQSVNETQVRLAVFRNDHALLDKRLRIIGRRVVAADGKLEPAQAFRKMALTYENALKGEINPNGVRQAPNIVDDNAPEQPAGFGAISRFAIARRKRLGNTDRKTLEGPIAEIPLGFDWAYYQTATRDQQIEFLRGNERLVLEGCLPSMPRLETTLPGGRAEAYVTTTTERAQACFGQSTNGKWQLIQLVADTLFIDADAQVAHLCWRVSLPVTDERVLPGIKVASGVALPEQPLVLPKPPLVGSEPGEATIKLSESPIPGRGAKAVQTKVDFKGTRQLKPNERLLAARRPAAPFPRPDGQRGEGPTGPVPGAPWGGQGAPPVPQGVGKQTMDLSNKFSSTSSLSPSQQASAASRPVAPFRVGQALAPGRVRAPVPGAPWSDQPPPVRLQPPGEQTIDLNGPEKPAATSTTEDPPNDRSAPSSPESTTAEPSPPAAAEDDNSAPETASPAKPKPPEPSRNDPAALARSLRQAGAANQDIAALLAALSPKATKNE